MNQKNNELIVKPLREDFIKFIDDTLCKFGFLKNSDLEHWISGRDVRSGGGVMIVNGQRINNPGEIHHIEFNVEVVGGGSIKGVDSGIEDEFVEVDFYMIENEMRQDLTPTMCMYFDDNNEFSAIINKILRM